MQHRAARSGGGSDVRTARATGLDIGTTAVRIAEASVGSGRLQVHRFGELALPTGAVVDGEIVDPGAVTGAVRQLRRSMGLKARRVAIGVANRRVLVRQVDLPWLPAEEMAGALRFQAGDLLPMPVEDAILDYHRLEEFVGEGGTRMQRVMLVAADSGMVRTAVQCVAAAGVAPTVVDLTPFALLRAVAMLDPTRGGSEAVVDIGAAVTSILVHSAGTPRFVRILMQGGNAISAALSQRLDIPPADAEEVKLTQAVHLAAGPGAGDAAVFDVIENAVAALVEEIRGSVDYYRAQRDAEPLSRVVLCGGGARLHTLAERLGAATRLSVVRAGDLAGPGVPRQRSAEAAGEGSPMDVAVATVGLALRIAS
jgi:type IV pilus assembly protein PilM